MEGLGTRLVGGRVYGGSGNETSRRACTNCELKLHVMSPTTHNIVIIMSIKPNISHVLQLSVIYESCFLS